MGWRWRFQRAGDGVAAAVEAQRGFLTEAWPAGLELRVRMGLHTGEPEERDGDYLGPPLNRAARLMSAAHGGQIVVSATTAEMLWSVPGIELVDLGSLDLRGVSDPIHAFRVSAEGVPWLERAPRTVRTPVGNLPVPVDEWFGPLADLHRRVASLPIRRLVTLTGTGGVGKTRLALEEAALAADEFRDGVWLVELAPVAEPASVALAVAATLSIQPHHGATVVEAIADWLRGRRVLLILDNCEHVLGAVDDLVTEIVTRCPTVTVLATSREPLGVPGERVVPLAGLDTPDAVALFGDRVSAVDDTVTLSADDHDAVVAICEELDGNPLAIEVAAARVRSLTPTEVRDRLGDRLRLLRSTGRRGSQRHRTLRATVDWSCQLLTGHEQTLFDRLSVFAGSFDLRAVETIGGTPPLDPGDALDVLASLVDKSMVVADRGAPTAPVTVSSRRCASSPPNASPTPATSKNSESCISATTSTSRSRAIGCGRARSSSPPTASSTATGTTCGPRMGGRSPSSTCTPPISSWRPPDGMHWRVGAPSTGTGPSARWNSSRPAFIQPAPPTRSQPERR
jgi:predicted ATPase